MILIGVAWLLVLAIALYQSLHGLFSAVIMALLTTICAVVALGTYEYLGEAFLYANQPASADAIALTVMFVIPLLALRMGFDRLIHGNAPLGKWADRTAGGIIGLYIGTVMVGILTIVLQMLPFGSSIIGYKPYDSTLQRADRIYCDEFALGVFQSATGLASDRSFTKIHDNLLLELFCARNTSGLNGRIDAPTSALKITEAYLPGKAWEKVKWYDGLKDNPHLQGGKSKVLIVKVAVSHSARSARKGDGWFRLPATHFRLVNGAGVSLYPLGRLEDAGDEWVLMRTKPVNGKPDMTGLHVIRLHKSEPQQEILWVYRIPQPPDDETAFDGSEAIDADEAKLIKEEQARMHAADYMVFRRVSRVNVPVPTPDILPLTSDQTAELKKKTDDAAKKKAAAAAARNKAPVPTTTPTLRI
ncbi:MAG: CvpA family protein [Phycisphaerae bacterium]|jgi:hypothetical protein|nr:CvpA family protein [Phycisphaerae bacterium]